MIYDAKQDETPLLRLLAALPGQHAEWSEGHVAFDDWAGYDVSVRLANGCGATEEKYGKLLTLLLAQLHISGGRASLTLEGDEGEHGQFVAHVTLGGWSGLMYEADETIFELERRQGQTGAAKGQAPGLTLLVAYLRAHGEVVR